MPAACRLGDICTGHGCFPPRPNDQGSPNVFINVIPAHRRTDHWMIHCCVQLRICHDSKLQMGSKTVFINMLNAGRIGDPVACGSKVATGSPNVFIGD